MALNNSYITDAISTIYTSVGMNVIVSGFFCNLHTAPVTVTVYLVPSGQTVDAKNIVYNEIVIAPGDTYIIDTEKIILDNGEFLAAVASETDKVTCTLITMAI